MHSIEIPTAIFDWKTFINHSFIFKVVYVDTIDEEHSKVKENDRHEHGKTD
jgi:hypothetical protein